MPEINYENIKESSILTDEEVYDYYKTVTQNTVEIAEHFGTNESKIILAIDRAKMHEKMAEIEFI